MTELIKKYYDIMSMYRSGKFGPNHLTLRDILKAAGEPDLFNKMTPNEIQYLIDNSSGMLKSMLIELKLRKVKENDEQSLQMNETFQKNNLICDEHVLKKVKKN